jgi:1,4-alpha-glucan branching enzyme
LINRFNYFSTQAYVSLKHEVDKVVVFERAGLLFIFNFHPTNSFTDYRVGVEEAGDYSIVLSSDDKEFGGHDRLDKSVKHITTPFEWNNRKNYLQVSVDSREMGDREQQGLTARFALQVYIPTRTCIVLAK